MLFKNPYLHQVPLDNGGARLANLSTGELLELDRDEFHSFKALQDPRGDFQRHALLVKDIENVRQTVFLRHRVACQQPAVFNLTLLPTLACNLACTYCFEQNPPPFRMSDVIADAVVALVHKEAQRHLRVELAWFGGEPLLEIERILSLQKECSKVCKQAKCEFRSSITTNGFFLNESNATSLLAAGINFFHITLDGDKSIHDANRPTKKGYGSFDQIYANIIGLMEINPSVRLLIRVNGRLGEGNSIFQVLENIPVIHRNRIMIHFHRVIDSCQKLNSSDEWINQACEVSKHACRLGYANSTDHFFNPGPAVYCYAERLTSAVVDPRGWVYKCAFTNFSSSERVGILQQDGFIKHSGHFLHAWERLVALEPIECMSCEYLPLCGFGCPRSRGEKNRSPGCKDSFRAIVDSQLVKGLVGTESSSLSTRP